jgi:hypothetical protein
MDSPKTKIKRGYGFGLAASRESTAAYNDLFSESPLKVL